MTKTKSGIEFEEVRITPKQEKIIKFIIDTKTTGILSVDEFVRLALAAQIRKDIIALKKQGISFPGLEEWKNAIPMKSKRRPIL